MFDLVKDKVFPFIKTINGEDTSFAKHMADAIFMMPKATVLDRVVTLIDKISMDDRDTKGDLYEYMLSKLQSSGELYETATTEDFSVVREERWILISWTQCKTI